MSQKSPEDMRRLAEIGRAVVEATASPGAVDLALKHATADEMVDLALDTWEGLHKAMRENTVLKNHIFLLKRRIAHLTRQRDEAREAAR